MREFFWVAWNLGLERKLASFKLLKRRTNLNINIEEAETRGKLSQGANKTAQETMRE